MTEADEYDEYGDEVLGREVVDARARRWSWADFAAHAFGAFAAWTSVTASFFDGVRVQLAEHGSHQRNRVELAESVLDDIKQL